MRPQGWESLLYQHLLSARETPFSWGTNDCVLWCADWVGKITGNDLAADYRGTYDSQETATEIIASLGFESIPDLVDNRLESIAVSYARRGDIMLHPEGMLGICDGAYAYFLTENGVTRRAFLECQRAWKVE